ncbi:MAG: phosphatidylinositol transfer protein [Deltaproteobacteria bacterium]|nr:phosphatidylinositol transfer protein [Deltaproteobacteria bacterium]
MPKPELDHRRRLDLVAACALVVASTTSAALAACGPSEPKEPKVPVGASTVPDLPLPDAPRAPVRTAGFRHKRSWATAQGGHPHHRVRDVIVAVGDEQRIEGKAAYGAGDRDLHDEDVVFDIEREPGTWDRSKVIRTSNDSATDDGGRAVLVIDRDRALSPGRHRVKMTVVGDATSAEGVIVVAPRRQPIFVSDVDGTLTSSELAEGPAVVRHTLPAAHPEAAKALGMLAARGLVPIYLTARPEWLVPRTRAFLATNGFPEGVLVTMRTKTGSFGDHAAAFKRGELGRLAATFEIAWAFGNMPSDAAAYASAVQDPKRRILYRLTDATYGCRRIESYAELATELAASSTTP